MLKNNLTKTNWLTVLFWRSLLPRKWRASILCCQSNSLEGLRVVRVDETFWQTVSNFPALTSWFLNVFSVCSSIFERDLRSLFSGAHIVYLYKDCGSCPLLQTMCWGKTLQTSNYHCHSTPKLTFLSYYTSKRRNILNKDSPLQHTCGLWKTHFYAHKACVPPSIRDTYQPQRSPQPSEIGREHLSWDFMGESSSRGLSKLRTYKETHMERLGSVQGLKRKKSRRE